MNFSSHSDTRLWVSRVGEPPVSIYMIRDNLDLPPYKLSCLFCKRTIADGMKGHIDKVIDGSLPAEDFNLAINIMCKQCNQKYRLLGDSPQIVQR